MSEDAGRARPLVQGLRTPLILLLQISVIAALALISTYVVLPRIEPARQGFFCKDPELSPQIFLIECRPLHGWRHPKAAHDELEPLNERLTSAAYVFFASQLGLAMNLFLYQVVKYSCGAVEAGEQLLTPLHFTSTLFFLQHFFDVCRPQEFDCAAGEYIEHYTCTGTNIKLLRDARMSFYSGHASTAFFYAAFLCRLLHGLPFLYVFHILLVSAASFVSLSRYIDNKHHAADIYVGALVGVILGVSVVFAYLREILARLSAKPYPTAWKSRAWRTGRRRRKAGRRLAVRPPGRALCRGSTSEWTSLAIGIFFFTVEYTARRIGPHKSGFYCDDKSIRLPYRGSTVGFWELIAYCVFIDLFTILAVEPSARSGSGWPSALAVFYGFYYAFELLIDLLTTITKLAIGRLRPHFIDVCRPQIHIEGVESVVLTPLSGCPVGLETVFIDIANYTCTAGRDYLVYEARKSFFSGHSSLAMGASTFAVIYLQYRLADVLRCRLITPILQVTIFGCGLLISFSRIFDYKHHWTDVSVGIMIGVLTMFFLCRYVAKIMHHPKVHVLPATAAHHSDPATGGELNGGAAKKRSFEWTEAYA
ncbi:hypothetical protein M3Y99_01815100 [Aphelenchoides fujianensis]|nr:hypothetical protein M3Y99_01815100 [Aphelenchoides fujianensis]